MATSGTAPTITHEHTQAATTWWVAQMDRVLSELTDFSNYCDGDGKFSPRRVVESFMSIEQFGRRLQGILAHDRDISTRRALAFDAFDTLKSLTGLDMFNGCKLSRAEQALSFLEAKLPSAASELLLLPARQAVAALRDAAKGFFLPSRTDGSVVRLPDKYGNDRDRPIEEAVALYLQLLRNANHSFTPRTNSDERRNQILMLANDGDVPPGVWYLPYLYWLEALADPKRIGLRLHPHSKSVTNPRPRR
jgi:hypothetical protein